MMIKWCLNIDFLLYIFAFIRLATGLNRQFGVPGNAAGDNGRTTNLLWSSAGGNSELDSWNYWWSYSGVSGPAYWGLLNADWYMCDKGRRQSPVNIDTRNLVYDPYLEPLIIDNNLISGILHNDGHSIVFNGSLAAAAHSRLFSNIEQTSGGVTVQENEPNELNANGTNGQEAAAQRLANDTGALFVLNQEAVETNGQSSRSALMKDLSRNIELSVGQSDRLELELGGEQSGSDSNRILMQARAEEEASQDGRDSATGGESQSSQQQQQLEEQMLLAKGKSVQFSGAGLAYSYRFETMHLRFGLDVEHGASEHQINGRNFGAELQLFAYNWQLYKNFAEASTQAHGLLAIAVLIDVLSDTQLTVNVSENNHIHKTTTTKVNKQLLRLAERASAALRYRANYEPFDNLDLLELLPETSLNEFVTYEGSLSWPGCHESVTWLVLNRPLYMTKSSLEGLRSVSADDQSSTQSSGNLIAGNIRPVQALNRRPVRTSIKPTATASESDGKEKTCTRLWTQYEYRATR